MTSLWRSEGISIMFLVTVGGVGRNQPYGSGGQRWPWYSFITEKMANQVISTAMRASRPSKNHSRADTVTPIAATGAISGRIRPRESIRRPSAGLGEAHHVAAVSA